MAYPGFHKVHPDFEHDEGNNPRTLEIFRRPVFYDTDGSPVYQDPWGHLRGAVVAQDDVAALQLYHSSPDTDIWYEHYEAYYWHPLFIIAKNGSMNALRWMLETYMTDPRYVEPLEDYLKRIEFSPINTACAFADQDMVLWLVHYDPPFATLHDRDTEGTTPLLSAAEALGNKGLDLRGTESGIAQLKKHEDFICFLLDQGCSIPDSNAYSNPPDGESHDTSRNSRLINTVLGATIPNASYKMVTRLLEAADMHAQQEWRDDNPWDHILDFGYAKHASALHIAARYWNIEGIRALLDHCGTSAIDLVAKTDDRGQVPLQWALVGPALRHRIEEKDEENSRQRILSEHLLSQRTECIKLLLESNPDIINMRNYKGDTCYNHALRSEVQVSSILPTVKMLLDAKPTPSILNARNARNAAGKTLLQDAVTWHGERMGDLFDEQFRELFDTLLDNGADIYLYLHDLCRQAWEQPITPALIDRLLELNNVNDIDADGCTALHYLVRRLDQDDAFHHLIKLGANVNIVDKKGNTPLHEVFRGTMYRRPIKGDRSILRPRDAMLVTKREWLKIMEEAGGSMDQPNAAGQTPRKLLDELTERLTKAWAQHDKFKAQGGRGRGRG